MNKGIVSILLASVFGLTSFGVGASQTLDGTVTYKSTNWKVVRSIDTMNDKVTCTGIYKDNHAIQLTPTTLYVTVNGGLETITLRYGDNAARSLRLPQDIEKKINAIIIKDVDFAELVDTNRLRVQASTLVRGILTLDMDISGITGALEHIKSGCPISAQSAAPTSTVTEKSAGSCSATLVSRMKAQGLDANKIKDICK